MKVQEAHEAHNHEVVVSKVWLAPNNRVRLFFQPKVTETIHRIEERKRTEEVERRVLRRERRHKSRSRYNHRGHQEAIGWNDGTGKKI